MRQLWTDDELDQALAELHADVRPTPNGLATVRARVLDAAPARSARLRSPWFPVIAAAAVAALVTSVLMLLPHTVQPAAPPSADLSLAELRARLAKIHYSDPTVAPGQYRYVRYQAWAGGLPDALVDQATTTWQPTTWTDEWLRRTSVFGKVPAKYANGAITATGPETKTGTADHDVTASCGNFDAVDTSPPASDPCAAQEGSWRTPTPLWLASLPKDHEQLLDAMMKNTPSSALDVAISALKTGTVPADVRAALYQALATATSTVSYGRENVPNLQGKRGLAIVVVQNGIRDELLVDPTDGSFLGERQYGETTGSVIVYSAMTYGVVDQRGVTPR
jgi:hypothetical protein